MTTPAPTPGHPARCSCGECAYRLDAAINDELQRTGNAGESIRVWAATIDPRDLEALEGTDDYDPDADRDDVLEDDTLEDESHVEREPWTLRARARVRRELHLLALALACGGFSIHNGCTHAPALASGGVA